MLLGLPAIICKFWHVLRVNRRRLYGEWHADRCAPPSSSPSSPLNGSRTGMIDTELFTTNQKASCFICIKWPHAIGSVCATANRLACHYRCLLLGGARGAFKKIEKHVYLFSREAKKMFMFWISKHCCCCCWWWWSQQQLPTLYVNTCLIWLLAPVTHHTHITQFTWK